MSCARKGQVSPPHPAIGYCPSSRRWLAYALVPVTTHQSSTRTHSSLIRLWLGRLALALFVPLMLLILMEGALRVTGIGYPTTFLVPARHQPMDAWATNPFFGYRFFAPLVARNPAPLIIADEKDEEMIRLAVLGESAAMGDPIIEYNLARALDKLLNEPGASRRFECLNAGMTAISSPVIVEIAADLARHDVDVFVIYMGNNEVIGPFGPDTVFDGPLWRRIPASWRVRVTRLRLAGLLRAWQARAQEGQQWQGMEVFSTRHLASDDPQLERVYRDYQRNLEAILRIAERRGIKVVLSTVAVNLNDFAPLGSQLASTLSSQERNAWRAAYETGVEASQRNDYVDARTAFERALAIDSGHAELVYRYARTLTALASHEEAAAAYRRARDLDTQRVRTDSRINQIIREVGAASGAHVRVLDLADQWHDASHSERFLDHVHFTITGTHEAAHAIADMLSAWYPRAHALAEQDVILDRLFYTPWSARRQASAMLQRRQRPPLAGQWLNDEHIRDLQFMRDEAVAQTQQVGTTAWITQRTEQMEAYPHDNDYAMQWIQTLMVTGQWDIAADYFDRYLLHTLEGFSSRYDLGILVYAMSGQPERSVELLTRMGPPFGYYLMDAVIAVIGVLENMGERDTARMIAAQTLDEWPRFPGRHQIEHWLAR